MPDATTINALGPVLGFLAVVFGLGVQAFLGARGKNSAYPARDEKHDANQGEMREIKTMIEAGFRNMDRRFDKIDDKQDEMHMLGVVIKDRTERK